MPPSERLAIATPHAWKVLNTDPRGDGGLIGPSEDSTSTSILTNDIATALSASYSHMRWTVTLVLIAVAGLEVSQY